MNLRDAIHEDPIPAVAKQSKKKSNIKNYGTIDHQPSGFGFFIYNLTIICVVMFFLIAPDTAQELIAWAVNVVISWVGY